MVKERAAFIRGYQKRSLEYLLLKKSKLSDGVSARHVYRKVEGGWLQGM